MDESEDFILVEDEDEPSTSMEPLPEAIPESQKVAFSERFSWLTKGILGQFDAIKDRLKPRMEGPEDTAAPDIEDFSLEIDGVFTFEWPIKGMDCPDCAAKAKRATQRLPGVKSVNISATMGTATVSIDMGSGHTSKVSSLLSSLGHEPDLPWQRIQGVTATGLAEANEVNRTELRQLLSQVPAILNVRFEDGSVELQIAPDLEQKISIELDGGLKRIVGTIPSLHEVQNHRLDSSQWRLVSTIPALAILGIIIVMDNLSENIVFPLTLLGVALSGWRMFFDAWGGLKNKELGFQLLTSLAVIGALFMEPRGYAEALMVSILVAISSHMEESALKKARDAMQGGLDRLPRRARRASEPKKITGISVATVSTTIRQVLAQESPSAEDKMVPIELIEVGDRVEVRSGEVIPVDGIVVDGTGSLNRAPLTGESIPVRISKGENVHAGLVLDWGPIVIEATAIGAATRLSGLIDEVRTFRDRPPRVQATVESFSRWWVPIVLVGAPLIGLMAGDIRMTLMLWVVACPCALLLAAPVPHAAALSTASLSGVVARGGDALEAAARIDLALLDKTGTLTSGHPSLDEIRITKGQTRDEILRLAAGLEQRSNHPYAAVILREAESVGSEDVTSLKDGDAGVEGIHKGKKVMFGRKDWLIREGVEISDDLLRNLPAARGLSMLARDGQAIAAFTFIHDDLRPGAAEMIHDLQSMGIAVELLSGDAQSAVEALGKEVGIPPMQCRGEIDPEGKAMWVERRSQGRRTLMAGDGFNDAAALAVADLGIAVGSGEQVNLDAADVLVPGEDPRAITTLIRIAKRTRSIVQFNILISVAITALLVTYILAGRDLNLAVGVAIHELSAFIVILNGAFVAVSGNRFALVWSVFQSLFNDYRESLMMLISKSSPVEA
ncbi:MAG: cation-translocating P-type ATPase [Candidatus Poseidoniales archaeon]|nr:cation-translocating P-type ATPase [Candidatus Poseidoniales archaeon]